MAPSPHLLRQLKSIGSGLLASSLAVLSGGSVAWSSQCEDANEAKNAPRSRDKLIFLGTGSSTGCPKPLCTMLFNNLTTIPPVGSDPVVDEMRDLFRDRCDTSKRAIIGDPSNNKDYRNNPSLLLSFWDEKDARQKNVVIDVGKTFREASLRWFPKYNVSTLDGIVISHEHADATFGLDEVRGYQQLYPPSETNPKMRVVPMKVFMSQPCLDKLSTMFPWLFPLQQTTVQDPSKPQVERFVSSLDLHIFNAFESMNVAGLRVTTLPVMHGEDLVSYGFAFTVGKTNVLYLSDISRMLPETLDYIQNELPPTDVLIVDSLYPAGPHPVHFSMEQALELVNEINPKQTYIVGINCDAFPPHVQANEVLRNKYGNVQLAHDGLCIEC